MNLCAHKISVVQHFRQKTVP